MSRRLAMCVSTVGLAVLLAGCYHATVETGLQPGTQTLEKPWASGWIYGLVPPSTVETEERCPNGVARVETQLSFPNMLVSWLTLSIYTPMNIKVTCASGGGMEEEEASASVDRPEAEDARGR